MLTALFLASCGELTDITRDDVVMATSANRTLTLMNRTDEPVYFMAVESEHAAKALYALCIDPAACPKVPARGSIAIPYGEIHGYHPQASFVSITYWRLVWRSSGFAADQEQGLLVRLR